MRQVCHDEEEKRQREAAKEKEAAKPLLPGPMIVVGKAKVTERCSPREDLSRYKYSNKF